ncbi:MAG TPA: aldose 1-epimerase family protein [Streptosporangiaceae bacterium]|nr:aldose 1-epimerase family protein [Streptosporangiaceae bacterium]
MTVPSAWPVTGAQYDIAAGEYQATVTELGAGLRRLSRGGLPVVVGYDADELPPAGAGQLLTPWPNRIDGGRYSFAGASYQLDLSEPTHGNAIHGLTRWASWRVASYADNAVELALDILGHAGYPFCLELRAGYRLTPHAGLAVTVTALNRGTKAAPFGTGSHPYLLAGHGGIDDWQLQLPAARWLPCDDRGIPTGDPQDVTGTPYDFRSRRGLGGLTLDHALTALSTDADGRARAVLAGPDAEVELWAGPGYGWLQVFTGDTLAAGARRRAVAIEPMTCPPNAFVSGADLLAIEPGATVSVHWGIQATLG